MLILEVTNAQDQLNLLKKIIDSTWSAISAEAAAEAAARQQRAAVAAAKPRVRRTAKPHVKPVAKSTAATAAVKPTQATSAEKTAAAIVQRDTTQAQPQSLKPQPRRVYPSTTAKPKPIARLGKVATIPTNQ
jgi:hypothetical protein